MATPAYTIKVVNVPDNLDHQQRSFEIEELANYLEVDTESLQGLTMVNYGPNTPPIDLASIPWIKTNPDGSPNGIYVNHGGDWVRATPLIVESDVSNLKMKLGTGTVTFNAAADTLMTIGPIASFTPEFDTPPVITISPTGGSVFNTATTYNEWGYTVDSRVDEFYLNFKCGVDCSTVNQTLDIQWMAIGARA